MSDASKSSGIRIRVARLGIARTGILLLLTFTLIPALAHTPAGHATKPPPSPPPSTSAVWARGYNIPYSSSPYSSSVAESVAQTSSGGYLVGGWCYAGSVISAKNPNCNGYATIIRVDSSGNIQSQTQYDFNSYPYTTPLGLIRQTSDGGAIFAGNAQFGCPATGKTSCAVLVKVDSSGNVQWNFDLQFSTSCTAGPLTWPFDLQQTTDGGYVLVGYTYAPVCSYNPWVAKLSSSGQLQWQHVFTDPTAGYSAAYSVQQTADGGYIIGGDIVYYVSASYAESKILVFKLDSTGALIWQHAYESGTDSYFASLALTSYGGVIVAGSVNTQTATSYTSSILLLKLDSTGNPQFARTYLPSPKDQILELQLSGVQQTSDGGYAFAGDYFDYTVYNTRAFLVKTDSTGSVQWDKIYGPDAQYSDRKFNSFQQTSDGGFIAAGSTNQFNNGYYSVWLVKTDPNGNISNCSDVKNDSYTNGTVGVTVSNTSLSTIKDGFSYIQDPLSVFTGALTATKEC